MASADLIIGVHIALEYDQPPDKGYKRVCPGQRGDRAWWMPAIPGAVCSIGGRGLLLPVGRRPYRNQANPLLHGVELP